jgi:hypothetical protein
VKVLDSNHEVLHREKGRRRRNRQQPGGISTANVGVETKQLTLMEMLQVVRLLHQRKRKKRLQKKLAVINLLVKGGIDWA